MSPTPPPLPVESTSRDLIWVQFRSKAVQFWTLEDKNKFIGHDSCELN